MNYFAHGRDYIEQPYFLAGVSAPDWLNVLDRRVRTKSHRAAPFENDPDPRIAQLAKGVLQHHQDDRWFHATRAFAELQLTFTAALRDLLDDSSLRPRFFGHILIEVLLDARLIEEAPGQLDAYYETLVNLDFAFVEEGLSQMTNRPASRLRELIPRFCNERFLYDYADDEKLLRRMNQVMRRVKLPQLPERTKEFFPEARRQVCERRSQLLQRPE